MLWFFVKTWMFMFFMVWVRGTLLRLRYDHFMKLGWKVLIPVALGWLVCVTVIQGVSTFTDISRRGLLLGIAAVFLFAIILIWIFGGKKDVDGGRVGDEGFVRPEEEFDAMAGGFPVPPLPGQSLPPSPRAARRDATPSSNQEGGLV